MGGYGSGRWDLHTKRATVEECKRFALWQVLRGPAWGSLSWTRGGEPAGNISYQVEYHDRQPRRLKLTYKFIDSGLSVDYSMPIVSTLTPWGSPRYWLLCSGCGRRCGNLYLPPSGRRFVCRSCGNLTYTTCQESGKNDFLAGLLGAEFANRFPVLSQAEIGKLLECQISGEKTPKRIEQKIRGYLLAVMLEELENRPDPYANYLTPTAICERSGLTPCELTTLKAARLLVPDHGDLYRPKLASWAGKLAYLLRAGWSLAEVKAWTRGRWRTTDPRRWPPEREC
jgi:hypothetical protein